MGRTLDDCYKNDVWDLPAVAIECKTYLDKTMLQDAATAAEQLKVRDPNAHCCRGMGDFISRFTPGTWAGGGLFTPVQTPAGGNLYLREALSRAF